MHQGSTADNLDMGGASPDSSACRGMRKRRWSFLEIAVIVGSFIVFWPLGIAALVLKLVKGELWTGASEKEPPWQNWQARDGYEFAKNWKQGGPRDPWQGHGHSGNAAFDDYRKAKLDGLEAERRKLDEERAAFSAHLAKLRRARDQEEFDRFMGERQPPTDAIPGEKPNELGV